VLSLIPLNEDVDLTINYEFNTNAGQIVTRSPLSRKLALAQAIRLALSYANTGAKVSITARGRSYSDPREFKAIWARPTFFQQEQ
jgi:hypothetical protein